MVATQQFQVLVKGVTVLSFTNILKLFEKITEIEGQGFSPQFFPSQMCLQSSGTGDKFVFLKGLGSSQLKYWNKSEQDGNGYNRFNIGPLMLIPQVQGVGLALFNSTLIQIFRFQRNVKRLVHQLVSGFSTASQSYPNQIVIGSLK